MSSNPYAPPQAEVRDIAQSPRAADAPRLWNPGAAAKWSLLFSPAFGAFVHMKNWQALGNEAKATVSKVWGIGIVTATLAAGVLPEFFPASPQFEVFSRVLGVVLLVSWYYSSGREQVAHVQIRYGDTYPRRGWSTPMLIALAAIAALFAVFFAIGYLTAGIQQAP